MAISKQRWAAGVTLVTLGSAIAAACSAGLGEQACLKLADAVGRVARDTCDGGRESYTVNYNATINAVAGGNCANITSVRDQDAFEQCISCILDTASCDAGDICDAGFSLPASCVGQLQR